MPKTSGPTPLASTKYEYDGNDNLMYVERLVNAANGGTYVTNSFTYTNANFPHFITGICNGDGTQVAENFYDDSGKLIALQDANGILTRFIHNTSNSMEMVVDRLGNTNTYVYDLRGNVVAQTNALGQVTTMAYDVNNNKTKSIVYLPNGQPYATNSYTYDTNLNVMLASTDPLGHTNGFTYDGYGNVLTSSDALGHATTNYYDSNTGNLLTSTDALGHGTTNAYTGGLLYGSIDAIGTRTTNYYDGNDNLYQTAVLDGNTGAILSSNTFAYDANGNRTNSTVWRQVCSVWTPSTTAYIYDAMNRVVQTIDPDNGTNTVVYDLNGRQQVTIDKMGRTNSYAYDALGRLIQTTYPDLTTETNGYDANGNRITSTDRTNRVTSYVYDALNRLTQTIYPDNTTNTNVYDSLGRVAQTIDARGTITAFAYDAAGRRIAVTNAFGTSVAATNFYGYDADGNQTTFTDANNHTTTSVFDALNRQTNVTFADGTKQITIFDAAGRRIAQTDQATNTTGFAYDGAGRLIAVTNALGGPTQVVTRYQYDEAGNETAQIDALNRTNTFTYDSMGRRIKHVMPGNQSESFGYDLSGNLVYATNFNGVIITNQYDVMNRLTNRASVNGYVVSYTYNSTGQRATMTDPGGMTAYSYDNRDRMWLKTVNWGSSPVALSVSLNYRYDANGNLTNLWSSTSGGVTNVYQYDALNRLTNVLGSVQMDTDLTNVLSEMVSVARYGYDAAGNVQTLAYHMGVTASYQYDALNRLTNLVWTNYNHDSAILNAGFYYQLGSTGNRTNLSETLNSQPSTTYAWQYDNLYRLTTEVISAMGSAGYGYDPVGNRTNRVVTGGLNLTNQAFTFNTNDWLNNDTYDSNGNTTVSGSNSYQYDALNHLTNVNNGQILMTYNGDGMRVSKKVGGTTTYYLLNDRNPSGYVQVLEEYKSLNSQPTTLNRIYNYGLALLNQNMVTNGIPATCATSYYGYDGHGNVRFLMDFYWGDITDAYVYDAYGNLIASNGVPQTAYLYCGEYFDSNLGQYYLRNRTLNPGTGRFWTRDGEGYGNNEDPLSLHKYLYCQDNPVNNTDPSGKAVYAMTRPLDIDGLRHAGGLAVHVYLAFDTVGVSDVNAWQQTVRESCDPVKHDNSYGINYKFRDSPVTFSFHPKSVLNGDHTGEYWGTVLTPGSYVAYNDRIDRDAFSKQGSEYARYMVCSGQDMQEQIYRSAVFSRDVNNRGQPDPGSYCFSVLNCGTWVEHVLGWNGIKFPDKSVNDGMGLGGGNPAGHAVCGAAMGVRGISGAIHDFIIEVFPLLGP